MSLHADLVGNEVLSAPGTGTTIQLGASATGFRSFLEAEGAGDVTNGQLLVPVTIASNFVDGIPTRRETATVTYNTGSPPTLTDRVTIRSNNSNSAIDAGSDCVVYWELIASNVATVSDVAYDATTWNGNTDVPTKNAVRDKFESLSSGGSVEDLANDTGTTTGLTYGYKAGTVDYGGMPIVVTAGTIVLDDDNENFVYYNAVDEVVEFGFSFPGGATVPMAIVTTATGAITDIADRRGFLFAPAISDEAYDATTWNDNTAAPTKNAIRDKFESLAQFYETSHSISVTAAAGKRPDYRVYTSLVTTGGTAEEHSIVLDGSGESPTPAPVPGTLKRIVATSVSGGDTHSARDGFRGAECLARSDGR